MTEPKRTVGSSIKALIRITISIGLVVLIYALIDRRRLLDTLSQMSLVGAIGILAVYTLGQLLSALKWGLFVRAAGLNRSWDQLIRAYFFGMFVNSVGLGVGTVGGDVARGVVLYPVRGERAQCFATVIADRIHGLLVLLTIGSVMTLLTGSSKIPSYVPVMCLAGVFAGCFGWAIGGKLVRTLLGPQRKVSLILERIELGFPTKPSVVIKATVVSVLFHSVQIVLHYLLGRELGVTLPLAFLFSVVPFINAVSTLPVSIMNGVGVREAMYVLLFVPETSREVAVAFGASWVVTVTLVSLLGGLLLPQGMRAQAKKLQQSGGSIDIEGSGPEGAHGLSSTDGSPVALSQSDNEGADLPDSGSRSSRLTVEKHAGSTLVSGTDTAASELTVSALPLSALKVPAHGLRSAE